MKAQEVVVGSLPASARLIDIYHHDAVDQNVQFKVILMDKMASILD